MKLKSILSKERAKEKKAAESTNTRLISHYLFRVWKTTGKAS